VALVVAAAALNTVAVGAVAAGAHHTALAEEMVAVVITGAEATRTTSPATHVAATMPVTGSRKFVAKRLLKQATATASPPTPLDFAIYSF
jgi:hypothetical protein